MEKPLKVVSLCPACGECPSVEVFADRVRLGEGSHAVSLGKLEWNQLVDAILSGKLAALK